MTTPAQLPAIDEASWQRDALVRMHQRLELLGGERGVATSAMLALGNLNDVNHRRPN
jgi:hypothetical protein